MSRIRKLAERSRDAGFSEGKSQAINDLKQAVEGRKPTIVHVEPRVDTKAIADALAVFGAIIPHLEAIAGKSSPEIDLSGVEEAISGVNLDASDVVAAISALTVAVKGIEGHREEIAQVSEMLAALSDQMAAVVAAMEAAAKSQEKLAAAFQAKRTLRFTDGGAVLEAT